MAIGYDDQNREILDHTPVEIPLGYKAPETLDEKIARAVRHEMFSQQNRDLETFAEADDFDVDDGEDIDFTSQYEVKDMSEEFMIPPEEVKEAKVPVEKEAGGEDGPKDPPQPPEEKGTVKT